MREIQIFALWLRALCFSAFEVSYKNSLYKFNVIIILGRRMGF